MTGILVSPLLALATVLLAYTRLGFAEQLDREAATTSLNAVTMNNYGSAAKATQLLAASGHRRIALLNGPERLDTARERRRGYLAALAAAGLPAVRQYIRDVEFGREHGATATRELLGLDTPPEAIFSTSLILTAGMLGAIRERGLHWPDDVAIVGFGEIVLRDSHWGRHWPSDGSNTIRARCT